MKETARKWTALLLAVWLLVGLAQPTAWATADEVTISSSEEFAEFSKNCSLDTWSQGKTFRLTADINLSAMNFTSIPTFGGTFLGDGHTISGFQIEASGSNLGLFRYIQKGAVVRDLHVSGTVTPDGSRAFVGGIAGVNAGAIQSCSFRGIVKGDEAVGGIVGRNDETGEIAGCTASGTVQGLDCTGGIAGRNLGLLLKCENDAEVNTIQHDTSPDLEDISGGLNQLSGNQREEGDALLNSHTDTGGVAGYSSGVIQSCVNNGAVGYPHVGYNVGGIAGRQTGYLADCVNNGNILGRKDVGGIAGQAEPYLTLGADSDTLTRLRRELDTLDGLVQAAIDHTQLSGDDISARLERIGLSADAARDSSKRLLDHASDFVDDNVTSLNSFSVTVTAALDKMEPALDDLSDAAGYLDTLSGKLEDALDTLAEAGTLSQSAMKDAQNAAKDLGLAADDMSDAMDAMQDAFEALQRAVIIKDEDKVRGALRDLADAIRALGSALNQAGGAGNTLQEALGLSGAGENGASGGIGNALEQIGTALGTIADNTSLDWDSLQEGLRQMGEAFQYLEYAAGHLNDASTDLNAALGKLEDTSGKLSTALEELADVSAIGGAVSRKLESAFSAMSKAVDRLAEDGPLELSPLGQEARDAGDDLYASLSDLSDGMEELRTTVDSAGDTLAADLRAVSRQMNKVLNLMLDAFSDLQDVTEQDRELIEDTSDEDISTTRQGKVTGCRNTGAVEGDRNVGGAVGAMAIEYDLDPEDDTERFSLGNTYETKAVLQNCLNQGTVTAKKDCAGGLAGRMDLGTALECQNYGSVTSTNGNYVGGVAGYADGTIRNSCSKCVLSGASYVGGIAGWASRLRNCAAIVTIGEGTEWVGAIAGDADLKAGDLHDNFFVDTGTAGVDGISYAGIAEPVDFETLRAMPGIPTEFVSFTLTLMANDAVVAAIPFYYGEDLSLVKLPEVPEREDGYGVWPAFDTSGLHSDITLEAVYTPWVTLIASEAREGTLSLALAEGRFTEDSSLQVSSSAQTPPAGGSGKQTTDVWELTLTGTDVAEGDTVPIRLLNRGGGKATVWQLTGGQWHEVEATANGHYLMLTMTGTSGIFCIRSAPGSPLVLILLLAAAALVLLLLILLIRRRKKKKAVKKAAK
ncbi:hypothetical protein JQM68_01310 [Oscillibacter valericigenes]|uniref:GLUG motif-containing protein n=1 Tax=Oscillibacter valericigenes TaxID=351091 RepID=UPI001F42765D|nr:GLUG motif-containing protein [Oscillibacter valericigenes]MCF2615834.1 hypothetical protein [Oscillibacter valericigenes]